MLRAIVRLLVFVCAFVVTVWMIVVVHTFLAAVPLKPLLGTDGITLLLCLTFGIAALAAGLSLSLEGLDSGRAIRLSLCDLVGLAVAIETYIFTARRLAPIPNVVDVILVVAMNLVAAVVCCHLALRTASRSRRSLPG